ncbi:MAG: pilus assembly protein PilM [Clostridiales bacterium]|nr:pilus assembly protein PilM [Clostridiales bacterium]
MGNKHYLGIDIGHDRLKLASIKNGRVCKAVAVQMPENLIKNGRIISHEIMIELIKTTMKANGIKEKYAALLLPSDSVYIRNITMPVMTEDQLKINLPYEFRDYFNEELHEYYYDYATYEDNEKDDNMELLAVAVKKDVVSDYRAMLIKCGFKVEIIAPAACAFRNIINLYEKNANISGAEYCFLDLGYRNIHLNFYKGNKHIATRELENGISTIYNSIANAFNVDTHLAHTYLLENFENCQSRKECIDSYNSIAIEILRSLNFYQFSNPDSQLKSIYISGGGASIREMINVFKEVLSDVEIKDASELIPADNLSREEIDNALLAIGIAL